MIFNITGRNINVTDSLRNQVEKKIGKLSKFFPADTQANVTLSTQKDLQTAEVTIHVKNTIIRTEESTSDMYASIDLAEESLERQIRKHRTRLIDRTQQAEAFSELFRPDDDDPDEDFPDIRIAKVKRFALKPMDPEEACMEMDLSGHSFFVFRNAETDETCVVYKRKGNTYGMIEPED